MFTVLLLAPPVVVAWFWRASVLRRRRHQAQGLPDRAEVVLARVEGIACTLLPWVQFLAAMVRYRTGEIGTFLWYVVPGVSVLLSLVALNTFIRYARGTERLVSSGMVVLANGMLLLVTLVDLSPDM